MVAPTTVHQNGAGPTPGIGPDGQPLAAPGYLEGLLDKREKMILGLNSLKSERVELAKQLETQDDSIRRTEGALIMLNSLIGELQPAPAGPNGGGG